MALDDDLIDAKDRTDNSIGRESGSDSERSLSPAPELNVGDDSAEPIGERVSRALRVLVLGRTAETRYTLRDRLVILLQLGAGGVVVSSLAAVVFDYSGIHSGPLWELQFVIRDVIMDGFKLAGEVGIQFLNNPLLTVLVVLASATILRKLS
jgi:hypothetical protein